MIGSIKRLKRLRVECSLALLGEVCGTALNSKAVRKTNCEICKGPEETLNRWQEHFNSLLNISSDVSQEVLDDVPQLPLREELDLPPSEEEVL